jgi:hypothetical protein
MGILQGLVSNGGYLYAAWKGEPGDDRIFYSRRNGSGNWAPSGTVDGNTSAGPSLGVFNGSLYAAWKGEWSDPRLFFAKYNGSNWENQMQIPTRIRRMARDFPAFLERFIYNDQCVMLD